MSLDDHDRCRRCGGPDDGHKRAECDRRRAASAATPTAPTFPTPAELRARAEAEDAAAITALVASLSMHLAREWKPDSREVIAQLQREPRRVVDAVIAKLAASGWTAVYHDDQREGRWLAISPA